MTRLVPVTVLVMLAAGRVASAQSTTLPNNAQVVFEHLEVAKDGTSFFEPEVNDRPLYFNVAHCTCAKAGKDKFRYLVHETAQSLVHQPLGFWVGEVCADDTKREMNCKSVDSVGDVDSLYPGGTVKAFSLYDVVNGKLHETEPCRELEGAATIWAFVNTTGGTATFDYQTTINVGTLTGETATTRGVDTRPPPRPGNLSARGGEKSIALSWDPPTSNNTDLYYYQALCANLDDTAARKAVADPKFITTASVCADVEAPASEALVAQPLDNGGEAVAAPGGAFGALGAEYVCGEAGGTANGMSIDGLENGKPYKVILLAIDLNGNFVGNYFSSTITPVPSVDFWEDLHGRGSKVEGGLCQISRTADGVLPTVLGLIAAGWWIRRRRRGQTQHSLVRASRVVTAVAVAVIALAPGRARAGGGYQPYWENTDDDEKQQEKAPGDPGLVQWHAGIRLGPYLPGIDEQFGGADPGPYKQMFGGAQILAMLDVDRIVWTGFGQLGVGISVGYMQKTANTFELGSDPMAEMRGRASDENTFRLLPTALTATYRFTVLDDTYGIPLVPYVRGGLAYYLWWLSADGDLVCKSGMPPDCSKNPPYGGSLGFVGSVGLAIRAERVDASTAMSMQQSGIQHAGIYGELSLAKVDGFGSETKLSVGDRTWFAGVNFEF